MFGSEVFEVAIGTVFVYFITSLAVSTLREVMEAALKTRAVQLERGIRQLLEDPRGVGAVQELYSHPLLLSLFAGAYDPSKLRPIRLPWASPNPGETAPRFRFGSNNGPAVPKVLRLPLRSNLPTYIPSRNFALALMHVVGGSDSASSVLTLDGLKATATALPDGQVRRAMLTALSEGGQDLGRVRASLEAWFDSCMDRVSSVYKRESQWVLMALGLVLAVSLNIDSIGIVRELSSNNKLRMDTVAEATKTASNLQRTDPQLKNESEAFVQKALDGLSGLIGWTTYETGILEVGDATCSKTAGASSDQLKAAAARCRFQSRWWYNLWRLLPGWLLTALAVSLGAPFWFDILNKFMIIRSAVKPAQKSAEDKSNDGPAAVTSAERLAVAPQAAADQADGPPLPAIPGPQVATMRLALVLDGVESLDPSTISLTVDGAAIPVTPDGFVEISLSVDQPHTLSATAKNGDETLSWSQVIAPNLNSEAQAITATLTAGAAQ